MSYSFVIRVADKAAAEAAVAAKMDDVVRQQAPHALDRDHVVTAAHAMISLLPDDPERDVQVTLHGWINTTRKPDGSADAISSVAVNVTASRVDRVEDEAPLA